jgi:hypothetical protein
MDDKNDLTMSVGGPGELNHLQVEQAPYGLVDVRGDGGKRSASMATNASRSTSPAIGYSPSAYRQAQWPRPTATPMPGCDNRGRGPLERLVKPALPRTVSGGRDSPCPPMRPRPWIGPDGTSSVRESTSWPGPRRGDRPMNLVRLEPRVLDGAGSRGRELEAVRLQVALALDSI